MATNNEINTAIPIPVNNGGTALNNLTAHGVLLGNDGLQLSSQTGTDGQLLLGGNNNPGPAFGTVTSTLGTVTLTPGPHTLDWNLTNFVDKTSFQPSITFGGGNTGMTYATRIGYYFRLNNFVVFTINIVLSAKGSSTGTAAISGLPLTATAINYVPSLWVSNLTFTGYVTAALLASGTSFELKHVATGGAIASLDDTAFANTTSIVISGYYFV